MPPNQPSLSTLLPPLVLGTGTFNSLYNVSPSDLAITSILETALRSGITALDTSPYYGSSETLLGAALTSPSIHTTFPRPSYLLITKAGRIANTEFDYSAAWIRHSVLRSLERLRTEYLDVVYAHDVEYVSHAEVLEAVSELRLLRDEGKIRYVGISGYPLGVLLEVAEMILRKTGEPLDVVQSYAHFTLQNRELGDETKGWLEKFQQAGVRCVLNASLLGMGLLRKDGVPVGGLGDWHPAPKALREKVAEAATWVEEKGETLENLALVWAFDAWRRRGWKVGGKDGMGVSVLGISTMEELQKFLTVWQQSGEAESSVRRVEIEELVNGVRSILGDWEDYAWPSPEDGYVNTRKVRGYCD